MEDFSRQQRRSLGNHISTVSRDVQTHLVNATRFVYINRWWSSTYNMTWRHKRKSHRYTAWTNLNIGYRLDGVLNAKPQPSYPWQRIPVQVEYGRVLRRPNHLPSSEFELRNVQLRVSRYTEYYNQSLLCVFIVPQRCISGQGRLIVEVSRSNTTKHISDRTLLNELSDCRRSCYLHNIQQTQETNIHALRGIRSRNPSNRAAADLCIRSHDNRDRYIYNIYYIYEYIYTCIFKRHFHLPAYCILGRFNQKGRWIALHIPSPSVTLAGRCR
jgi:hypothetical protein